MTATPTVYDNDYFRRLATLPGWEIATRYGLTYDGEPDPIENWGVFYDGRHWEAHGVAASLQLYRSGAGNRTLIVTPGTVHKLAPDLMTKATAYALADATETGNTLDEIAACHQWSGARPTGLDDSLLYDTAAWEAWRVWASLHPTLLAVAGKGAK